MVGTRRALLRVSVAVAGLIGSALPAQETTTYKYDALGRLVTSVRSGGPNNGVTMGTCFDRAGNRARYDVATSMPAACPTPTPTPAPSP